jgi:type II secretion system protein G
MGLMAKRLGFTLIELLVVVAIIAILAAIAVPNFLAAQTRAKVARARNDLRVASGALEAYRVDNGRYPFHRGYGSSGFGEVEDAHHQRPRGGTEFRLPDAIATPLDTNRLHHERGAA